MSYALTALIFAELGRRTGARLFAWFAAAFILLAAERATLTLVVRDAGAPPWGERVRLLAFALVLVGIAARSRPPRARRPPVRGP
jgi:hypothetical protein